MRYILSIALLSVFLQGCAGYNKLQLQQNAQDYADLPPAHFKNNIRIEDDSLDTVASFSTEPGFRFKQGLLGLVWDDSFIRGVIHKNTGVRAYQIYTYIAYRDSRWRFYRTANYESPGGPRSVRVTRIDSDVDCTGSQYSRCRYEEHVGFVVDEDILREVAALAGPTQGQLLGWKYKIAPRRGEDFRAVLSAAEVKGLLDAMDEYSARR